MLAKFKSLFKQKSKRIGIEINPLNVKIAQVIKQKQSYKLINYVSAEVPEGVFEEGELIDSDALAQLIKETLTESKIRAEKAATGLPLREAIIRLIAVPAELNEEELSDMVLNHEAPLYLPYPREEVDLDYQKLGYFIDEDGIEKVNVMLVATRKEVTDLYINTIKQAGLETDVIEINNFALIRTIREQLRQFGSSEAVVLVDIEFENTEVAIIVDGVPQYSRTVPIGAYQLQDAMSQEMNLPPSRSLEILQEISLLSPPEEVEGDSTGVTWINPGMAAMLRVLRELIEEIGRSINFYLNQSSDVEIAQLLLAGPGGGIAQLDEYFTEKLNIPTIQIDPITALAIEVSQDIPAVQRPGLGTVLGLGLREV
jgi:type IV pilus assembly protein PilM